MKATNEKQQLIAEYLQEMRKAWNDEKMINHFKNEVGQIARLTNGGLFIVKKSRIETSFCFGYHTDYTGHERTDAENERQRFLNSVEAFRYENTARLEQIIEILETQTNGEEYFMMSNRVKYNGEREPLNVYDLQLLKYYEYARKYGGFDGWKEKTISDADRQIMLKAYKDELQALNKRLDTYLKKYGMKHLRTWTYWLDE